MKHRMYGEIPMLRAEEKIRDRSGISVRRFYGTLTENSQLHWHDYYTLDLVLEGVGEHLVNGKTYPIQRGDAYLVRPTDIHVVKGFDLHLCSIRFTDRAIPEEYRLLVPRIHNIQHLDDTSWQRVTTYADSIEESNFELAASPDDRLATDVVRMSFSLLLLQIAGHALPTDPVTEEKISLVMHWLEMHFRENPTVDRTAQEAGLSPAYFSAWFKKHTGKSYVEYLTMLRLSYACSMLRNGFSITDSCYSSGFGSLSHFNHTFKKQYGMSPRDYQQT